MSFLVYLSVYRFSSICQLPSLVNLRKTKVIEEATNTCVIYSSYENPSLALRVGFVD